MQVKKENDGIKKNGIMVTRPEASLFLWSELTEREKDAVRKVNGLLASLMKEEIKVLHYPSDLKFLPFIDIKRFANTILIDGERGAGKTTVMIFLLYLWSRGLGVKVHKELFERKNEEIFQEVCTKSGYNPLEGHIVPVKTIDLQPIPDSTAMLVRLMMSLRQLVETIVSKSPSFSLSCEKRTSECNEPLDQMDIQRLWENLLQAATTWNGNIEQRKRDLDPEAFAIELQEAEKSHGTVTEAWRRFINRLINGMKFLQERWNSRPPIIVIPIDDADMNPDRCHELIWLVRTFWHPRIVYLMTGETDLFIRMLKKSVYKQMDPGKIQSERNLHKPDSEDGNLQKVRELAHAIYEKVIPPGNRAVLQNLVKNERKEFKHPALPGKNIGQLLGTKDIEKHDKNKNLPIKRKNDLLPPENLGGYLNLDESLWDAVPSILRLCLDFWIYLNGKDLTKMDCAVDVIMHLVKESIDHENYDHRYREQLEDIVSIGPNNELIVILSNILFWHTRPRHAMLSINERMHFKLMLEDKIGARLAPDGPQLSARTISTLKLAANAAADIKGSPSPVTLSPGVITPGGYMTDLITVHFTLIGGEGIRFDWPVPVWRAPIDFSILMRALDPIYSDVQAHKWDDPELKSSLGQVQKVIDRIAAAFLKTTMETARTRQPKHLEPDGILKNSPDWQSLARELFSFAHDSESKGPVDERKAANHQWAERDALLLASPESGLSSEAADDLLRAWFKVIEKAAITREKARIQQQTSNLERDRLIEELRRTTRQQGIDRLKAARYSRVHTSLFRERMPRMTGAGIESSAGPQAITNEMVQQVINAIDSMFPDHPWLNIVEGKAPTPANKLLKMLGNIPIIQPQGGSVQNPNYLNGYLNVKFGPEGGDLHETLAGQWIHELSTREQDRLSDILAHRQQVGGGAALAVRDIFMMLLDKASIFPDWVPEALKVEKAKDLAISFPGHRWRPVSEPGTNILALDERRATTFRRFRKMSLRDASEPDQGPGLHSQLESVLCLATNVAADQQDIEEKGFPWRTISPDLASCRLILDREEVISFPWLFPEWPAAYDAELIGYGWNHVLGRIPDEFKMGIDIEINKRLTNYLANAYLQLVTEAAQGRRYIQYQRFDLSLDKIFFEGAVKSIHQNLTAFNYRGRRWEAFHAWAMEKAVLIAAPESGLSDDLAEVYLSTWLGHEDDEEKIQSAKKGRIERARMVIRASGQEPGDREVHGLLKRTNEAFKDHPWTRYIEQKEELKGH